MDDKQIKRNEDGARLCDQEGCELLATHTMIWTDKWQCYCIVHANKVLGLGEFMGHLTPKLTIRPMTIDEMVSDD